MVQYQPKTTRWHLSAVMSRPHQHFEVVWRMSDQDVTVRHDVFH